MCGVAGVYAPESPTESLAEVARAMAGAVQHRGPDDSGVWYEPSLGVALGHARLSILDLSPSGHQPMLSPSGRFVASYNGEIYNHAALRRELETHGVRFHGRSDTEVLLAAIDAWGVDRTLSRLTGMFAFALVDRRDRRLHLARDRIGEKPLYHGWNGEALLFGSELKALRRYPNWRGEVDRDVLALYARHNYVPSPYSIYRGIGKLRPGTFVTYRLDGRRSEPLETVYWSCVDRVLAARQAPPERSESALMALLEQRLEETVQREMVADVPVGAFLSGGVDSSLVVALMKHHGGGPIRTFTIGFEEVAYDESVYAATVARHLGTEHMELRVTPHEARGVIPDLPRLYDEPFADPSQIATHLVARLAAEHVKVCLTGDGGDELFGGYLRYLSGARAWSVMKRAPSWVRSLSARLLTSVSPRAWDHVLGLVPAAVGPEGASGRRLHRLAELTGAPTAQAMYHALVSYWPDPNDLVIGGEEPLTRLNDGEAWAAGLEIEESMMLADLLTYLPDDILVKVDRASMGVGLETRAPFLDHELAELAWRLPMSFKVMDGRGKAALKSILERYLPGELVHRPKAGFGVPVGAWLRGPLRKWADTALDPDRLRCEGYLRPDPIRERWSEHLEGARDWEYQLWGILMFQAWLETQ